MRSVLDFFATATSAPASSSPGLLIATIFSRHKTHCTQDQLNSLSWETFEIDETPNWWTCKGYTTLCWGEKKGVEIKRKWPRNDDESLVFFADEIFQRATGQKRKKAGFLSKRPRPGQKQIAFAHSNIFAKQWKDEKRKKESSPKRNEGIIRVCFLSQFQCDKTRLKK
jgi:hypothetical protein